MEKTWAVYILASKKNGTLYIGRTENLPKRIWGHKNKVVKSFTEKYNINMLVYYEIWEDCFESIKRERNMKKWKRTWKLRIIEEKNPSWKDLSNEIKE